MCRYKIINAVLASILLASATAVSQAATDIWDLPTIAEGLKSPDRLHRAKHVEELKKTIRSRLTNHDEVRLVAQFLQDNPVPEALPDLIDRIDYSQHIGSIKSPSYEYPYFVALACLGSPAGSAIIDSISSDEKEFRRYLLRDTLLQAVGLEESVRLLKLRVEGSTGVARARLQEQLDKIEKSRDRLSTKGIPESIKGAQAKAAIAWAKLSAGSR